MREVAHTISNFLRASFTSLAFISTLHSTMANKFDYEAKDTSIGNGDAPPYDGGSGIAEPEKLGFWTRMGCTPESFKRREQVDGQDVALNTTLKTRHLHMIAIGGSIGAGLFVGSGSALSRGVSIVLHQRELLSCVILIFTRGQLLC
jgi:amino acid permease